MAGVTLTNVKKVYPGEVVAVHETTLDVADKEFMVLVGPSGCGKTTTLRMIAGLEEVSEGTIRIGDRAVNGVPPKDRDIAMVFQNYAIYPHMTVYDNMAFGLKQRKTPRAEIERRVRGAAAALGIEALLGRRPKALSGGQRQRVALGRAIVREPKVFLFDEPLSNLDAKMRVEMRKEIKLLHQRLQATMIYVTHDQVEAMTLGDRICVMNAGRIEQVGCPIAVYDRPRTRFVAAFIGTPPMNFWPGRLLRAGGTVRFEAEGFRLDLPPSLTDRLQAQTGGDVELGVRPEALEPLSGGSPAEQSIPGTVQVIEALGNELLAHLKAGATPFVARLESHARVSPGDALRLRPDWRKAHIFDAATGENRTAVS